MRSKAEAAAFFDDCERELRAKAAGYTISGFMMRVIKGESIADDSASTTKLTLQSPLTELSMNIDQGMPHSRSHELSGTNSRMKTSLKRKHDNQEEFDRLNSSSRLKKSKAKGDAESATSATEGRDARSRSYTTSTQRQSISAKYFVRPSASLKTSRKYTRKENLPAASVSSSLLSVLRNK